MTRGGRTSEKRPASPSSTGGAGYELEALTGAVHLAALLTGGAARPAPIGRTATVEFQRPPDGVALDDLVVTVETTGGLAKLAFQIKRRLDKKLLPEVIAACWRTFDHPRFHQARDRMIVACGAHSPRLADWQYLCDAASHHSDASRFFVMFTGRGTSNATHRQLLVLVRKTGTAVRGTEPSDEAMLAFLRRLTFLPLDISATTSPDCAAAVERLKYRLSDDRSAEAGTLFETLVQIARKAANFGGSFDQLSLRQTLQDRGSPIVDVDRGRDEQRLLRHLGDLATVADRILGRVGYIPQRIVLQNGARRDALPILHDWLSRDGSIFLLLGDYGTGKSSTLIAFGLEHAAAWKKNLGGPLPIFVSLEKWARDRSLKQHVVQTLADRGGDWNVLARSGQALLLLDGFDEIRDSVSEADLNRRFDEIAEFCADEGVRAIVTSRTHFFKSDADVRFLTIVPRVRVEIGVMQDFTPENVDLFVERYAGREAARLRRLLSLAPSELSRRPLILSMLVSVLPEFRTAEEITLASIFGRYTERWFRSQAGRGVLSRTQREQFCIAFAALLHDRGARSADARDVEALLRRMGAENLHLPLQAASADVRTVALIVRDSLGSYSFGHGSIGDYFLALAILGELESENRARLERAAVSDLCKLFVRSLLRQQPAQFVTALATVCGTTRSETVAVNLAPMLVTGDDKLSKMIIRAAQDADLDHRTGRHLVWTVGEIGAMTETAAVRISVVEVLQRVLGDVADDFVLWNAAFAHQKCDDAVDPLRILLDRLSEVRDWTPEQIVARISERRAAIAVISFLERSRPAATLLGQLTEVAVNTVRDVETRYNAVWSVGRIIRSGRVSASARRHAHAAIRRTIMDERVNYMQSNLVEVLGSFADPADAPIFDELLRRDDIYFRTKVHAVDALRSIGSDEANAILSDVAPLQIDPAVRLAISRSSGRST